MKDFLKSYATKRVYEASFWIGISVIVLTLIRLESITIFLMILLTIVPDADVKGAVRRIGDFAKGKLSDGE